MRGARLWGKQKEHKLISKATLMGSREKLDTKIDEAFALLMYDNYIDKWEKQGNIKDSNEDKQHEEDKDEQHDGDKERKEGEEETAQSMPRERKNPTKAVKGKYTVHNNGTTKYSEWSDTGMACFNELYNMVKEDRQ